MGVAWSGVCENFLGTTSTPALIDHIHRLVHAQPALVGEWDGRFGVCTWQELDHTVTLTTAATDSPTFWYSQGPDGWAIGNRALPLLKLVGQTPALDLVAASVFVNYGYLAGNTALFKNVFRFLPRQQVVLSPHATPKIETYLPLDAYFRNEPGGLRRDVAVRQCAEQVVTRVARQLQHSTEPEVLLTGGRDSRWIAAAAVTTGASFKARTSGPFSSKDVSIAKLVASKAGIDHEHEIGSAQNASVKSLAERPERVALWTEVSEGIETIRHALPFWQFFHEDAPFPVVKRQVFHGLHAFGGLLTLDAQVQGKQIALDSVVDCKVLRAIVTAKTSNRLTLHRQVKAILEDECMELQHVVGAMRPQLGQWLNVFYWQNRCTHWGQDMMSVKDLIDWHWTPLLDRHITRAFWHLDAKDKFFARRFVEDATRLLMPSLRRVKYDIPSPTMPLVPAAKQAARHLKHYGETMLARGGHRPAQSLGNQNLRVLWDQVLFSGGGHVWPELIDAAALQHMVEHKPSDELLWNLATVELFVKAHL